MPFPIASALGATGVLLVAYLWGRSKKSAVAPADAPTSVVYVAPKDPPPADAPTGGGGGVKVPIKYTYTLRSGDTPLGLAKTWTGDATTQRLYELSDANPDLKRTQQTPVVYIADTASGMPVDGAKTPVYSTAYRAAGVPVEAQVTSSTPKGGYPNNPIPSTTGKWYNHGATSDTLYPWQIGQVVQIPEAWGEPPVGVDASQVAVTSGEYA